MLARLLIVAMLLAAVAVISGIGLGLPFWSLLLTYSLVGTAVLLVGGAVAYFSGTRQAPAMGYGNPRVEPVRIQTRP